jgi:hypothetical protein
MSGSFLAPDTTALRSDLLALLTSGDYRHLDDPDDPPWFEPGVTSEVHPQFFRFAVGEDSTDGVSPEDAWSVCHLVWDEMFPPRLYWKRDGLYLARELAADEAFHLLWMTALFLLGDQPNKENVQ